MNISKNFILAIVAITISNGCEKDDLRNTSGVTFTEITNYYSSSINFGNNLVEYNEILGYDSSKHVFSITNDAGERIRKQDYPTTPTPFAIVVDGELIYIANFIPGYSSASCYECISVEPYSYSNKYRVELGYPSSSFYTGSDPRNDFRIISRFEKDKKLIYIDL